MRMDWCLEGYGGPRTDILNKFAALLAQVRQFIDNRLFAGYLSFGGNLFRLFSNRTGPDNFMSYGGFPDGKGDSPFPRMIRGKGSL